MIILTDGSHGSCDDLGSLVVFSALVTLKGLAALAAMAALPSGSFALWQLCPLAALPTGSSIIYFSSNSLDILTFIPYDIFDSLAALVALKTLASWADSSIFTL